MTDKSETLYNSLQAFIAKAKQGQIVQHWTNSADLTLKVTQALTQTMRARPGIGWVRGNVPASSTLLIEVNDLRKQLELNAVEINNLRAEIKSSKIENLLPFSELFEVRLVLSRYASPPQSVSYKLSWEMIFKIVGPSLIAPKNQYEMEKLLVEYFQGTA